MIGLETLYAIAGAMFAVLAFLSWKDRESRHRLYNASFWGIYAVTFWFGSLLPNFVMGCLVIALAAIAATGRPRRSASAVDTPMAESRRVAQSQRFGNLLFLPALLIPVVTLIGTLTFKHVHFIEAKNVTLASLVLGTIVAFVVALLMLRDSPIRAMRHAGHTMDTIGWAAILPQMLAALGAVFALSGVGTVFADIVKYWVPQNSPLAVVVAYTFGMALFTMIMGNAFAAFPVMTVGIGLPLLVHQFHGNPAIVGAIGMLSGFCGTLMTPLAANFNVVPAALLELSDKNGVIKAQWPTALLLLMINTAFLYLFAFRF